MHKGGSAVPEGSLPPDQQYDGLDQLHADGGTERVVNFNKKYSGT